MTTEQGWQRYLKGDFAAEAVAVPQIGLFAHILFYLSSDYHHDLNTLGA